MAISHDFQSFPSPVIFTIIAAAVAIIVFRFVFSSSSSPNAPKRVGWGYPFVGTYEFFNARWDLFRQSSLLTASGNFTFFIGPHQVVGLSGDKGRETFFESRDLSFSEGYATLLGTAPGKINERLMDKDEFDTKNYFSRRLTWLLRGERFGRRLPKMINDVQTVLNKLGDEAPGIIDPFEDLGHIVALMTMRAIGCDDIADDPILLEKSVYWYLVIKNSATPMTIMYPWFPTPTIFARTRAGFNLYMALDKIVKERKRTGKKGDDPLQYLLDEGDGMSRIISFVIGALFAGLENSAIAVPWVLLYLSQSPHWLSLARAEITSVCATHNASSLPLLAKLTHLPVEVWESSFPILDLCLKECIRLQTTGTAYRRNVSGKEVRIAGGDEVIPDGALVAYHFNDVHRNENFYPEPERWDPGRYVEGMDDGGKGLRYVGWGAGMHPCLGMRFAKMENSLMLAFFLTMFDFELVDKEGNQVNELPPMDLNNKATSKPKTKVYLKYTRRAQDS